MITLYTAGTPNGYKISIALEELGLDYKFQHIKLSDLEQKQDWFLKLNPNGRIPVIIDHDNNDYVVFETGAILLYLAEKTGKLLPKENNQRYQVIQWLFFQMAGIGPMQGQAHVFIHSAPTKIDYAIQRYQNETRRLYQIIDQQLQGRDYIVDDYSIADIACWPWVRIHERANIDMTGLDNLLAWIDRIANRPAVQRGILVPKPNHNNSKPQKKTETA